MSSDTDPVVWIILFKKMSTFIKAYLIIRSWCQQSVVKVCWQNSDLEISPYSCNINGKDVQRKNAVNNVDKSSLWAPWQNGPYKNTQNITKHEYTKTQQTFRNNYFLCFSFFSVFFLIFNFQLLKGLLQKMLNYHLGTVNENQFSAAVNLMLYAF